MLERWDAASQTNRKRLEMLTESVEEVIGLTENAVTEISKNFRVVVAKAHEQTEAAMSILQEGEGQRTRRAFAAGIHQGLRLPAAERHHAHERLLGGGRRDGDATRSASPSTRKVMEETIDGLRNMASQISRIALDSSVAMTSQTLNSRDFIEMTDRIRAISGEAHELTRKTRQGLDAIGDEVRQGNKRTTQVADAARRAVEVARSEIDTLNEATIAQTRQIEVTLKRINDLSVEIQKDINQIIIAMQFQDITRQKLERIHKPTLGAAAESLSLLSHETQALLQRDLYRAVRAYSESALKPRIAERGAVETAASDLDKYGAGREGEAAAPPDEKKVEIF